MLIYTLKCAWENEDWKIVINKALKLLIFTIAFMFMYLAINKLVIMFFNIELLDYRGISSMGKDSVENYLTKIINAYKFFINPTKYGLGLSNILLPGIIKYIYIFSQIIICTCVIKKIIFNKNIINNIFIILALILMPLSLNLIFIMCRVNEYMYAFMMFGALMYIPLFIYILENTQFKNENILKIGLVVSFVAIFVYAKYDNAAYIKADFEKTRTINYFNNMISQIKGVEGYKDELPVCYLNEYQKEDKTFTNIDGFNNIVIDGTGNLINNYCWRVFVDRYCGWNPKVIEEVEYKNINKTKDMPHYPDDGSIKVIDGVVVVKY